MDNATYEAISAAQNGDRAAIENLTKENMPLIRSVVMRFRDRGTEEEDLIQLGAIGFIKAIRGFDLTRGLALSTYAVPLIMGEVRRHLRDSGMIKVSRSVRELAIRASAAFSALSEERGNDVPLSAVAEVLGVTAEEIAAALEAVQIPDSLHRPIGDGDGLLMDVLAHTDDMAERATDRLSLLSLLHTGDETEKNVILCRYFHDKTQNETARLLGLSQVQVSRAEKRAILRLRQLLVPQENR